MENKQNAHCARVKGHGTMRTYSNHGNQQCLWGYSINQYGFGYIVNPNPDSVKKCTLLTNLNPDSDSVNPALIPFHCAT